MTDLRQPHPEALLMFPIEMSPNLGLDIQMVTTSLYRQQALSSNVPYKWGFIDKPKDGEIHLIHHRGGNLADGLMFLEQEHRYMVPKTNPSPQAPDIECYESRQGFIPGLDNQAFRIRRRFHFARPPGMPQLWLVHYSRANQPVHVAQHLHQQIRNYPLPHLPGIFAFVTGPRAGEIMGEEEARQIVASVQSRAPEAFGHGQRPQHPGYGGGVVAQDISAQTEYMKRLDQRKRMMAAPPSRRDDEDSPDEDAAVSVRTLALSRYRRNHELMEEVFQRAAFGSRKTENNTDPSLPAVTLEDINGKLEKTMADVAELEKKAAERQRLKDEKEQAVEAMVS